MPDPIITKMNKNGADNTVSKEYILGPKVRRTFWHIGFLVVGKHVMDVRLGQKIGQNDGYFNSSIDISGLTKALHNNILCLLNLAI
jgi:hypothetical protein